MTLQTLRKPVLQGVFAIAITFAAALLVLMPNTAYADEEPQNPLEALFAQFSELGKPAEKQTEFSASIMETCVSLVQQANEDLVVEKALSLEGSPYVYGGTTPRGFDCSGFTKYVFANSLGIELPRTAGQQAMLGESVSMDELQPGDLLFWGSGSGVYHVAIYVKDNTYVHAAGTGKGVRVSTMEYFQPSFAKRILQTQTRYTQKKWSR